MEGLHFGVPVLSGWFLRLFSWVRAIPLDPDIHAMASVTGKGAQQCSLR